MIKSMTGYGKSEVLLDSGKLTIEIRTLNGKSCDVGIKTPLLPKDKELLVRQEITSSLTRGTIDFFMTWEPNAAANAKTINSDLVVEYYNQIMNIHQRLDGTEKFGKVGKAVNDTLRIVDNNLLSTILRFPDVMDNSKQDIINDDNWEAVHKGISEAIAAVNEYRSKEGEALYKDVTSRITNILNLENEVEGHEPERIAAVREKLMKDLEDLKQKVDPQRFEQEMIFYIEKLDINEEKVRLRQHCKYFMETINSEPYPGKKLGFIIQEMGREINTTGSKANHAEIQKCVVKMKDELEKIREQSMNIL
jgi:uncharacterized protein (TIGR00255 family)